MTGIIDVGGGLRGIYGTGVFDFCLDNNISFDYCMGVSAGSANLASFLAGQRDRNRVFYMEYSFRKDYMSLQNVFHCGSFFNLDYIYDSLSNADGENPLNFKKIMNNKSIMKVVSTDAQTGEAVYFDKSDMKQDDYNILKASCAIPLVCKPLSFEGKLYYDGGVADPVPLNKAFSDGCEKVFIILTRPVEYLKNQQMDSVGAKLLEKKYPKIAEGLLLRYDRYNRGVALARRMEKEGKAVIIAPDDCCGVDTLSRTKDGLGRLYQKGYYDAKRIFAK